MNVTCVKAKAIILWVNSRKNTAGALVTPTNKSDIHLFLRILVLGVTELLALALCVVSVAGSWPTRMNDLLIACRECMFISSQNPDV